MILLYLILSQLKSGASDEPKGQQARLFGA